MKKIFPLFLLFLGLSAQAQDIKVTTKDNDLKLPTLPYYNFGRGLGLTSPDSLFQLNIRFRMQNRVTYIQNEGEDAAYDGQIRRLRLRFDGYVGNPKFLYALQLSFAPGDVGEIEEGENINIIRDAVVYYRPNKSWSFSFGQTKLPGNRQRVNSSGGLQLTDRSINNAKFTIDRDFGFQAHYLNDYAEKFSYNVKTAVSTGEGRNWTKSNDNGVALTGKVEILPFGAFTKDGVYFEGDIAREKKPKLMLSAAFQQNNHARRTQGQLGDDLFEQRTMKSVMLDAIVKYDGWAAMSSYMSRTANNPVTVNPEDVQDIKYVFVGSGMDYQLSYLFPTNYEIIGRFSTQKVHDDIRQYAPNAKQYSIGLTKYIWEHAFKLQGELTLDDLNYFDGRTKQNWYLRFQIEIGI
ncbi:porin [Flavobacterium lindanitolerans]|uniref:Phosphate-selective porin O/P n=1 Tax=Flavobacterium lindanitolerans TaxID=428988 RepID=A0A497UIC7_9FLAO|nr:porin [Flavobacterium lindanitolerans]PKW21049.1 phosphate-selective porin O/P [Flavobacterium lindanitolerans]RLJ30312.1 phosphate-selective porin O/P [Flavobacterium lindanitolerans]